MSETPQVDDIWKEVDPRATRFVRVVVVAGTDVRVVTVTEKEPGYWVPVLNEKTKRYAPARWADLRRFNGKRGGYALHLREIGA